jgi:HAD superfamily hydrolase (TIGR01509 family)
METATFPASGAVIFDMDGLMLDTEGPAASAWIEAARQTGWNVAVEVMHQCIGVNEESTKQILMGVYGSDFPYDRIRTLMRELVFIRAEREGIPHRPGLKTLLDHLARLDLPLAVATSTAGDLARWRLRKAGILERFAIIVCGDEVKRGKPAPDIFLLAAERLGKIPAECIGFEDSPAGLRALHAAGIPSVFVKDMLEPPEAVLNTVWRRFGDLAEAVELFRP